VGLSRWAVKNTGIGFLKTAVQTGKSGRPDGTRATSLSPFFWCGAFGRDSRREFRRASRVSLSASRIRTIHESFRTVFVPIAIWHLEFYFVHEHLPILETNTYVYN
jgi:hypothetical protein